jgi:hypothetical protein
MADPFDDLGQYRWSIGTKGSPRDPVVETPTSRAIKAHRRIKARSRFMPAVSCGDAFRWHRVGPHALIIMLVLKRWQAIGGEFPTVIGDQLLGEIGILPQTRDRALAALEKAGLVMVDRQRGRLPRIWMADRFNRDEAAA